MDGWVEEEEYVWGPGGSWPQQIPANQFTQSQPGGQIKPTTLLPAPPPQGFSDFPTDLEWKKRSTSGVFLAKWFHCAHPGLLGSEGLRAAAPPGFGRSVNPIQTRGSDHTHQITTLPSGYSDLPTALTPQPLSPHWILPLELPHSLPPPSLPSPAEHMETAGNCPHLLLAETFSSKVREPDYAQTWFENVPPGLRPTRR